ncbi:MAG: hypothetical protein OK457_01710 [Thaumarchaeota archaeon]|nr:hypothetical protein [Nitrososphaerota archaeon]
MSKGAKGNFSKNKYSKDAILARIEQNSGVPNLSQALERIEQTDLQTLLLEVYRRHAGRRGKSLLTDYSSNRFVKISEFDPVLLNEWDGVAYAHLPQGFRSLELSPLCPLGTVSGVAPISQDWIITTLRNSEVVSDSTNVLALEGARLRNEYLLKKSKDASEVKLCCSHRVVRAQRYEYPEAQAHFRLFSLCSAGRDTGEYRFEAKALQDHVQMYVTSIRNFLQAEIPLKITISTINANSKIYDALKHATGLSMQKFASLTTEINSDLNPGSYYNSFTFQISAMSDRGKPYELVDGGDTDWTQKLLSSSKERLVISGIGSERVCSLKLLKKEKIE